MYIDEFAARLHQLEDPYTDVQTRHAADQWLTQFRDSPHAWLTAQSALSSQRDPSLWPHAAQILAYKCKRQLAQIDALEQRIALLHALSTALATLSSSSLPSTTTTSTSTSRALTQGLCVAISNLILQISTLPRPLETLGSLLNQQTMLEFLTVLPGECEDAYASLQTSTASEASEAAFLLKQRAGEWCIEVGAWLYNVVTSTVQSNPQLAAFLSNLGTYAADYSVRAGTEWPPPLAPSLVPCISCFSAWIKWGGLFFMAQEQWEYILRLSSAFFFVGNNNGAAGNAEAAVAVAGVEALSEAIERPAPATQRILLEICLRVSQHICTAFPLGSTDTSKSSTSSNFNFQYCHMTHVFTTYCTTNANIVASHTPEGAVLRNALLHLVALAGEKATGGGGGGESDLETDDDEDEEESAGVPAVDALGDVLEAIVDSSLAVSDDSRGIAMDQQSFKGENDNGALDDDDGDSADEFSSFPLLSGQERMQFTSTVLSVLLQYSQVPALYLLGTSTTTARAGTTAVHHPRQAVVWLPSRLKAFRTQAEWPLWLCGEILLANTFVQQLYSFFQTRSTSHMTSSTANMTSSDGGGGGNTIFDSSHRTSTPETAATAAIQALEVCFYAITKGSAGAFSEDGSQSYILSSLSPLPPPPPAWLGPLLSLFAAAKELDPCRHYHHQQHEQAATLQLSMFHFYLLSAFATVAKPLMKAIASMPEQCQGLMELIFNLSGAAITASAITIDTQDASNYQNYQDQSEVENESVVEAAAMAVCAALSSPAEVQVMALAAGAIRSIDTMLAALMIAGKLPSSGSTTATAADVSSSNLFNRRRDFAARKASQQLMVALVHALHAPNQHAAASAQEVVRNRALKPLVTVASTAATEASNTNTNNSNTGTLPSSHYASSSLAAQFNVLHACLEDVMALLNALESHIDSSNDQEQQQQQGLVVGAVVDDAVAACLAAWPNIMTALSQAAGKTAAPSSSISSTISNISALIYHDASQCLCSCIHLVPGSIAPSLSPLLESMYSTFFLPGGHSMHRILCALLEINLSTSSSNNTIPQAQYINTLVTATGSLLTAPAARKFYSLGGGDEDPDAACAVLTLATCLLRQASTSQWNSILSTTSNSNDTTATAAVVIVGPLVECVHLALRLAAANAACNHRGVCQRAIATLSAALVLILDTSCTALHSPLLQIITCSTNLTSTTVLDSNSTVSGGTSGGVVIMQGIVLCLLSLHSISFLPKIVNLMSDIATLAVVVACWNIPQVESNVARVTHAAGGMLHEWWNRARMNLELEGARGAGAGGAAATAAQREFHVLNSLNWEPLVAAAAVRVGNGDTGSSGLEAKRGIQRAVRQVADQIRKNHGGG